MSIIAFALSEVLGLLEFLGKETVSLWKTVAPKAGDLLSVVFDKINKNEPIPLPELKISLVAPSGFGKTTLLSTVMKEIDKNIAPEIEVAADSDEDKERIKLNNKTIDDSLTTGSLKLKSGLEGSGSISKFKFNISMSDNTNKNKKIIQPFSIIDAPGGWIAGEQSADLTEWKEHLRESRILWMPINATVLMSSTTNEQEKECRTKKLKIHEMTNWAEEWAKYHKTANSSSPACIFYVPVKCEKYLSKGDKDSAAKLSATFKEIYGGIIKSVRDIAPNVEQYYVPVETIGSAKLNDSDWNYKLDENNELKDVSFEENYVVVRNYREIKNADILLKKIYEYAHDQIYTELGESKKALEKIKNPLKFQEKAKLKQAIATIEKSLKPLIDEFGKNAKISLHEFRV